MKRFFYTYYNKVLYYYALAALMLPNIALCFTEKMGTWACAANILLPLGIYTWFLGRSKRTGKMVWWLFLLIFFAAFQLVLLYLFGKGVIAVDMFLNLVTTNPGEAMELLDNLVPAVAGVFIVYLPLLTLAVISCGGKIPWAGKSADAKIPVLTHTFRGKTLRWGAALACLGLISLANAYIFDGGNGDHSYELKEISGINKNEYKIQDQFYPVNVFYNLWLAIERNHASNNYQEASASFRFYAHPTHPQDSTEVYVMVIGETARAYNFSLYGYQRDTNPLLSKTQGLIAFDQVTTQSNTTHKSVPMLLSAADATDFERLYHEKGILAAFKEAGFHTVFVSNQLPNHSFIDFLGEQADEWTFVKTGESNEAFKKAYQNEGRTRDKKTKDEMTKDGMAKDGKTKITSEEKNIYDADLLPILDQALAKHYKKLFVVLHTYGSHFNYQERYPRAMAYFNPDTHTEAKAENRRDLLNAYDNTIRYTDYVLHSVIERLLHQGGMAAMLYTSDHGENIFDDSRQLFLHASPTASEYELHVPFLIWTSPSYAHQEPSVEQALVANKHRQIQSSRSAFHTMLNLGGIATRYRQDDYSAASQRLVNAPLLYLSDHNEAVKP